MIEIQNSRSNSKCRHYVHSPHYCEAVTIHLYSTTDMHFQRLINYSTINQIIISAISIYLFTRESFIFLPIPLDQLAIGGPRHEKLHKEHRKQCAGARNVNCIQNAIYLENQPAPRHSRDQITERGFGTRSLPSGIRYI